MELSFHFLLRLKASFKLFWFLRKATGTITRQETFSREVTHNSIRHKFLQNFRCFYFSYFNSFRIARICIPGDPIVKDDFNFRGMHTLGQKKT